MPTLWFASLLVVAVPQEIALPVPTGPYAVGTWTHVWRDGERADEIVPAREFLAGAFTLWYPAEPGAQAERASYDPLHAELLAALREDPELAVWASRLAPVGRLVGHALREPTVLAGETPLPMLIVSPGGNVSRRAHTALCEDLASHGIVVVAVSHPYSGLDLIAGELHASHERWRGIDGDDDSARRADDALCDHLALDARGALDRVLELARDPDHLLHDRVDDARVAILGHSRGGSTVGRACSTDARFRAAIVLDNIGPDREGADGLEQPHLAIRTDEARRWDEAGIAGLRDYLARNQSAGYEAVIHGAVHMSFTDLPFAMPQAARGALASERVLELTSSLVRAFLARHVDGDEGVDLESVAAASAELELTVLVSSE